MNIQLIPVFAGEMSGASVQLVDARLLHSFLEVANHFREWIKDRIADYGFQENQDYLSFAEKSAKPQGGRPTIEYHITIDMAKELSMVERNDKGKQARRYFIEMERRALEQLSSNPLQLPEPKTKSSLPNGLTLDQQDTIKQLVKDRVAELPKDKQGAAAVKCWSSIKKKYGCTYKAVEPEHFTAIVSLLARLPLEGELLEKPEPLPAPSLADIEALIERKLIESKPQARPHIDNANYYGIHADRPGEFRWISDIPIEAANKQLARQGLKIVRI